MRRASRRREVPSEEHDGGVQPAFHRAEVAIGDLGDLFVGLTFQLPQHEHFSVVFGQLIDRPLYQVPQVPLAIEVIGTIAMVFELEWAMIGTKSSPSWRRSVGSATISSRKSE